MIEVVRRSSSPMWVDAMTMRTLRDCNMTTTCCYTTNKWLQGRGRSKITTSDQHLPECTV
eukprot:6287262-Amphidinium_carterae.1